MVMARTQWTITIPSLSMLLTGLSLAALPYNPSSIFIPESNTDAVLLLRPVAPDSYQYDINLIELSSYLGRSPDSRPVLSSALPFTQEDEQTAFTTIIEDNGNINFYVGDCSTGIDNVHVWRYMVNDNGNFMKNSWTEESLYKGQKSEDGSAIQARFLSTGFSYSPSVSNDPSSTNGLYIFGGMCPNELDSDLLWTAGNYSDNMIRLDQSEYGLGSLKIESEIAAGIEPPTAQAGSSLTPLKPTYVNISEGIQDKQQDFLLIGGQTETAFIHMSQVALFSLPQESWTFISVNGASEMEAGVQVVSEESQVHVEPRSGHTAILSSDGRSIIVFGGWVGDIDTPAKPQLAVLQVGEGYGGEDEWYWTTPQTTGPGLEDSSGIYGHGAALLPDNILIVAGGYLIPAAASKQKKASQILNDRIMFFNITSNEWLRGYSPQNFAESSQEDDSGSLSTIPEKVGLGIGLSVAFLLIAFMLYCFSRKKRKGENRYMREKNIRQLSLETNGSVTSNRDTQSWWARAIAMLSKMRSRNHSLLPTEERSWQNDTQLSGSSGDVIIASEQFPSFERREAAVEVLSASRGVRKNTPLRAYNPGNPLYEKNPFINSGYIHPIDEVEEEEVNIFPLRKSEDYRDLAVRNGAKKHVTIITPNSNLASDLNNNQGQAAVARRASIRNSVNHRASPNKRLIDGQMQGRSDTFSPDADELQNGRGSPDKSDRTISSLSERSQRSNWSSISSIRGAGDATLRLITRSLSGGSSAVQSSSTDPFLTPGSSPTEKRTFGPSAKLQGKLMGAYSVAPPPTARSYNSEGDTAFAISTGFAQLQAEGEALLGGATRLDEMLDDFERINDKVIEDSNMYQPDTPRKNRVGWIGSVRRALARTTSGTGTSRVAAFLTGAGNQATGRQHHEHSFTGAPYTDEVATNIPRRAVSDGGFWHGKRGARDWAEDMAIADLLDRRSGDDWGAPEDMRKRRHSLVPASMSQPEAEADDSGEGEDWDVEAAAERRVVQVSFTVPRTRLRVVNVDADKRSLVSVDERKTSGKLN